jgi:O-antigen/teichoic acid export membrane protein
MRGSARLLIRAPHMKRPAWNLLTGTLTRYILLFVNIAIGIFLMPFTMHHLGASQYGLWMLAASMTAYLQLLDLGYGNGLVRQLTHADARGDKDAMNAALSTFLVVYGVIAGIAMTAILLLATFALPRFPSLSPEDVRVARAILMILGIRVAIAFPMSVFGAVTTARQRFTLTGSIAIVVALVQGAATYLVLRAGYGLITLVATTTGLAVASYIAYVMAAYAAFPGMRLSISRFKLQEVRGVTSFSMYVFLISLAIQFGYNIDNLIIAAFAGTSAVAIYAVAFRLADYQRQLCNQFNGLLFPVVVRFSATEETTALRAILVDGTRIALGLIVGVTICLVTFADRLVALWMGPGFAGSLPSLYLLAGAGVVLVAAGPLGNLLLARGREPVVAFSCLGEAIMNATLSIWLVRKYGIVGAAAGTLISVTISNVFIQMPAACRLLSIPVAVFLRDVLTPSSIALVPTIAVAWALRSARVPASLLEVVGAGAVVACVYLLAFILAGLRSSDRARYFGRVRESQRPSAATVVAQ